MVWNCGITPLAHDACSRRLHLWSRDGSCGQSLFHQHSILPECRLRRHQPDLVSVSQSTTALQGSQRRRPGRCGFPLNQPQARGSPSKNSGQQKRLFREIAVAAWAIASVGCCEDGHCDLRGCGPSVKENAINPFSDLLPRADTGRCVRLHRLRRRTTSNRPLSRW
jgi:hypothetical protein